MKQNHIRKHNIVSFYISGISYAAFMAMVAMLTELGYTVSLTDLHIYDDDNNLYSATFDLNLTPRYHVYGVSKDWKRMREAATLIYFNLQNDLLSRGYSCGSISLSFFRDSDDVMVHHYTVYTVDYSTGNDDGSVHFVRLR